MFERRESELGEVREVDGSHQAEVLIVTYGVVDSYGTSWKPGVFQRSIEESGGSIPACWAHHDDRPIGVVSDFRDDGTSLRGTLTFLDFDAVPDARMAYEATRRRAIKGVSFGFTRRDEQPDEENRGATRINEADLFEISPVLRPSVPGSKVLAVRSNDTVSKRTAADILVKFSTGELDLADALVALKAGSTGEGAPPPQLPEDFPQPGSEENKPEEVPVPQPEPESQPEPDPEEEAILSQLESLSIGDE